MIDAGRVTRADQGPRLSGPRRPPRRQFVYLNPQKKCGPFPHWKWNYSGRLSPPDSCGSRTSNTHRQAFLGAVLWSIYKPLWLVDSKSRVEGTQPVHRLLLRLRC